MRLAVLTRLAADESLQTKSFMSGLTHLFFFAIKYN
jgi:hypothetical protein